MSAFVRTVFALTLACTVGCSLSTAAPIDPNALRVLFVGNSLTYTNDLPRTVADLASSAGERACYCIAIAYPDYALEDHIAVGEAFRTLQDERFDFVVMQQGPSALSSSRVNLLHNAILFGVKIREKGARGVMFSVWPSSSRMFDFSAVHDSYREAADSIGGVLAPAGTAWQVAWEQEAGLPFYSSDGFHPSEMGTYLAALVIFERLYGRPSLGVQLQARVGGNVMSWRLDLVRQLQQAATEALRREPRP